MHVSTQFAYKGLSFENEIRVVGIEYWMRRIAWFDKVEVAKGFDKKSSRIFYKKKTGFDFYGAHFYKNEGLFSARPLFFEVKDINEDALPLLEPLSKNKSGVHYHQLDTLMKLEEAGCECWILWRTKGKVFRLSPTAAFSTVGIGKSVRVGDEILEAMMNVRGMWDFLGELTS